MKTLLLAISLLVLPLLVLFTYSGSASALEPGCYSGSTLPTLPERVYTPANCPAEGYARAVSQFGACFVITGSTTAEERDCNNLDSPGNAVPESQSFSSSQPDSPTIDTDCDPDPGTPLSKENCGIVNLIVIGINFLSAVAGMAIIASIMIAGYQYMTAQDNAGQIQKAKQRIIWAITALLLFIFMYALLNFLVPGGVL